MSKIIQNVCFFLSVFPSFTNIPNNVTVKTGQDAKLLCEAQGYPQPYLSWSKDGGQNFPAARDRRFHVNPDNLNEFIIKDVQWQDRGTYFCNATNIAGSIISNATVNVMGMYSDLLYFKYRFDFTTTVFLKTALLLKTLFCCFGVLIVFLLGHFLWYGQVPSKL